MDLKKHQYYGQKFEFVKTYNKYPDINSVSEQEKRLAECVIYLKEEKRKRQKSE